MAAFDEMMAQLRAQAAENLDPDRSTVPDEIDAMDWQFSQLARLITDLENYQDKGARGYAARSARRHLDTLVQRAFRAKLIAQGQRVTKA